MLHPYFYNLDSYHTYFYYLASFQCINTIETMHHGECHRTFLVSEEMYEQEHFRTGTHRTHHSAICVLVYDTITERLLKTFSCAKFSKSALKEHPLSDRML